MSAQALTRNATATHSPSSRRRSHSGRRNSRRLTRLPVHVPIPPSLIQSPYIHSPQSIFRRASSAPRLPSEEDDEWLRDTVPLRFGKGLGDRAGSVSSLSQITSIGDEQATATSRGRSPQTRVPSSPPLVRRRQSTTGSWFEHAHMSRSEPDISKISQGCFDM